jgi:CheY-like chemotaxis protein
MPEADGLSVVMRLLLPGNRPMEAIVITASSYEESAPRCGGIGAVYIRKGEGLLDKIREALLVMFPDLDSWEDDEGANTPAKAEQWTRPRVLVVGADLDLDDFLSSRLQKYDIDTVTARDGMRGFYTACTEEPSVVVTKYTMPNGDAQFLLQKLRSQPETANLPVFIISDEDVDEVKQARMRSDTLNPSGVVQFFTQPIDADEFFAALGRYCALAMNPNPRENISVAS